MPQNKFVSIFRSLRKRHRRRKVIAAETGVPAVISERSQDWERAKARATRNSRWTQLAKSGEFKTGTEILVGRVKIWNPR